MHLPDALVAFEGLVLLYRVFVLEALLTCEADVRSFFRMGTQMFLDVSVVPDVHAADGTNFMFHRGFGRQQHVRSQLCV